MAPIWFLEKTAKNKIWPVILGTKSVTSPPPIKSLSGLHNSVAVTRENSGQNPVLYLEFGYDAPGRLPHLLLNRKGWTVEYQKNASLYIELHFCKYMR